MKLILSFLILGLNMAQAKEVRNFNKVLIENVQSDLKTQNDDQFKKKVGRAPASIESEVNENRIKEDNKIDKMNIRQIGSSKW